MSGEPGRFWEESSPVNGSMLDGKRYSRTDRSQSGIGGSLGSWTGCPRSSNWNRPASCGGSGSSFFSSPGGGGGGAGGALAGAGRIRRGGQGSGPLSLGDPTEIPEGSHRIQETNWILFSLGKPIGSSGRLSGSRFPG